MKVLKNVRCSEEIWNISNVTLEEALDKAKSDPRVKALHWYKNNGGDGLIYGIKGWYQGGGGEIGKVANNDWDTIILENLDSLTPKTKIIYPPFKNGLYL